jgi:hypothetical protein
MDVRFDPDTSRLQLTCASLEALEQFLAGARRESGFLVTLPQGLPLHLAVTVGLSHGADSYQFVANVAQVFDKGFGSYGTAFLVTSSVLEGLETMAAEAELAEPPETPIEQATTPQGTSETPSEAPQEEQPAETPDYARADGEVQGISPIHRIKEMNPRQRANLAMRANRTERKILLRDTSPVVLQGLLANPHLDSEDVLRIARSSHVIAPILQRIATDPRWSSNQELLAIVAKNPKIPSIFATRLVPSLRTSDLRTMAKLSSGTKQMTRKAALREYMRRTGQKL